MISAKKLIKMASGRKLQPWGGKESLLQELMLQKILQAHRQWLRKAILLSTALTRSVSKIAALGRKRITTPRTNVAENTTSTSSMAEKGHFVVYSTDQKRFVMPIAYLNNCIFQELLRISEEEFGLSSEGPIILPCDSIFLEYVHSLIQRGLGRDLEKALLNSIATTGSSCSQSAASFPQTQHTAQQLLVSGYY